MHSVSLPSQNSSLYTLPPNQLEQTIEQLIAAKIWMGMYTSGQIVYPFFLTTLIVGQLGPSQGGFQLANGQSPVRQVVTEWRLNVSIVINFVNHSFIKSNLH